MLYNQDVDSLYMDKITTAVAAKQYKAAFDLLTERNDLIWAEKGYSARVDMAQWQRIESAFTKEFLVSRDGLSDEGEGFIFIVGMPRCGKTTLEGLLGAIDTVQPGGELPYLHNQYSKVQDPNGQAWEYPDYIPALPDEVWSIFARQYVEPVRGLYPQASFIIDTMPPNFRYLGFLRLILPKAKVIHIVRDPLEHCVDIFSKKFNADFYNYTYNLDALSGMYCAYRRLMAHWDGVLGDWLHTVKFEDLIGKPKKELKKVLSFCGIEADQSVQSLISPHQNMLTEINRSIGVLKNYRPYLKDFEASLGTYKNL